METSEAIVDRKFISKKIKIGEEVLYINQEEIKKLDISIEKILELTKHALIAHGLKKYEMPAKIGIHPLDDVFYHAMPAYVPSKRAVGIKWIECYPNNPKKYNLPQTTGLLILNDLLSGCPIAIMDASWITAVRTPAVTVLAAQYLHPNARTFGMFGCGVQGKKHVEFVTYTLKNLENIYVFDIKSSAINKLINDIQPKINVEIVEADNPKEIANNCEVLSSATIVLKEPQSVIKSEWISRGQTILPCDLNTFWDPIISKQADKYIVDSIEEHELFAKMGYYPDGLPDIDCETGEVIAEKRNGRENEDELIVCSNAGMAVCDVVLGRELFNLALTNNLGTKLPL